MEFVLLGLGAMGLAAVVGFPVRISRIGRWVPVFLRLETGPKLVSALGVILLVPATPLWLYCLYVGYKVFWDPGVPRIWGGSELGMTLTAFAIIYLLAELLLLPVTLARTRLLSFLHG